MDIKQLVTGNPKAGFYPITQDTITVIELNKAVMNLTNESGSEEIIAAFDNLESFQALIAEVRNPQNICSGILINETPEDKRVGKYEASIIANTDAETLHVRWIEIDKIVALTITNTDGTMSCIRNENNVGGGSGESNIYKFPYNFAGYTPKIYNDLKKAIETNKIIIIIIEGYNYKYTLLQCVINEDNNIELIHINGNNENIAASLVFTTIKPDGTCLNGAFNIVNPNDVLTKNNTTPFTPDADYEPATKKYVDNRSPLSKIITESEYTALGEAVNTDGILYFVTPDA